MADTTPNGNSGSFRKFAGGVGNYVLAAALPSLNRSFGDTQRAQSLSAQQRGATSSMSDPAFNRLRDDIQITNTLLSQSLFLHQKQIEILSRIEAKGGGGRGATEMIEALGGLELVKKIGPALLGIAPALGTIALAVGAFTVAGKAVQSALDHIWGNPNTKDAEQKMRDSYHQIQADIAAGKKFPQTQTWGQYFQDKFINRGVTDFLGFNKPWNKNFGKDVGGALFPSAHADELHNPYGALQYSFNQKPSIPSLGEVGEKYNQALEQYNKSPVQLGDILDMIKDANFWKKAKKLGLVIGRASPLVNLFDTYAATSDFSKQFQVSPENWEKMKAGTFNLNQTKEPASMAEMFYSIPGLKSLGNAEQHGVNAFGNWWKHFHLIQEAHAGELNPYGGLDFNAFGDKGMSSEMRRLKQKSESNTSDERELEKVTFNAREIDFKADKIIFEEKNASGSASGSIPGFGGSAIGLKAALDAAEGRTPSSGGSDATPTQRAPQTTPPPGTGPITPGNNQSQTTPGSGIGSQATKGNVQSQTTPGFGGGKTPGASGMTPGGGLGSQTTPSAIAGAIGGGGDYNRLADAIEKQEGYGRPGTIPTDYNNPGDLRYRPWEKTYGAIQGDRGGGGGHAIFPDYKSGRAAMMHLLQTPYYRGKSIAEIGASWAKDKTWGAKVAEYAGWSPDYVPHQSSLSPADNKSPRELSDLPQPIINKAHEIIAGGGGPGDLQQYLGAHGYQVTNANCGKFASSIIRDAGGTPPPNPEIASNWLNWKGGQRIDASDVRAGDIAVRTQSRFGGAAIPGQTGSHVTISEGGVDKTGRFRSVGASQGGERMYPANQYAFFRPYLPQEAQPQPHPIEAPQSAATAIAAHAAATTPSIPTSALSYTGQMHGAELTSASTNDAVRARKSQTYQSPPVGHMHNQPNLSTPTQDEEDGFSRKDVGHVAPPDHRIKELFLPWSISQYD